jgi:hypothetical protein
MAGGTLTRSITFSLACVACGAASLPSSWRGITEVAPAPMVPLTAPTQKMHADKGAAPANYPASFGADVSPDGSIAFPDSTTGKIEGNDVYVAGSVVASLTEAGEVSGTGLHQKYKFNDKGELLDGEGRGVRISPEGGVRGIGGRWRYKDVVAWTSESGKWDYTGWRALTVVSLLLVESMAPEAIRSGDAPAEVAALLPLTPPPIALRGEKGSAPAPYPTTFAATIKSDGTVAFPDATSGKIKGASIYVGGSPMATLNEQGEVSGPGLKHKYKFNDKGELLDPEGHGVRLLRDGGVRGVGGRWRYKDVMVWSPVEVDKQRWDHTGWRGVLIVSLVVIENMLPDALR